MCECKYKNHRNQKYGYVGTQAARRIYNLMVNSVSSFTGENNKENYVHSIDAHILGLISKIDAGLVSREDIYSNFIDAMEAKERLITSENLIATHKSSGLPCNVEVTNTSDGCGVIEIRRNDTGQILCRRSFRDAEERDKYISVVVSKEKNE